jgi:hypothetical protein
MVGWTRIPGKQNHIVLIGDRSGIWWDHWIDPVRSTSGSNQECSRFLSYPVYHMNSKAFIKKCMHQRTNAYRVLQLLMCRFK